MLCHLHSLCLFMSVIFPWVHSMIKKQHIIGLSKFMKMKRCFLIKELQLLLLFYIIKGCDCNSLWYLGLIVSLSVRVVVQSSLMIQFHHEVAIYHWWLKMSTVNVIVYSIRRCNCNTLWFYFINGCCMFWANFLCWWSCQTILSYTWVYSKYNLLMCIKLW